MARHTGKAAFVVDLVDEVGLNTPLVDAVGAFRGELALDRVPPGLYLVVIDTQGKWMLRFEQPRPSAQTGRFPLMIRGTGWVVESIRTREGPRPTVVATYHGPVISNFVVRLVGYGELEGGVLFNELGPFQGAASIADMPAGEYLLSVVADGPWTIKFIA
jgi:hypothetical protein